MIVNPIITIGINAEGKLEVQGPINNKIKCYGFLEAAKDIVRDYEAPSPITLAPPGLKVPINPRG